MKPAAILLLGLLAACQGAPPVLQARTCTPFDKVDLAKLSSRWENFDGGDVSIIWRRWLAEVDREEAGAALSSASLNLRIAPYPLMEKPRAFDIRGARIDGVWRMKSRTRTLLRSGEEEEGPWRDFVLSERNSRELDGILDDDCFWNSPRFLASQIPMRGGGIQTYYHHPLTHFEVRQGEREWGGLHEVMAGSPGDLVDLLLIAAYPEFGNRGGVVHDFNMDT